MEKEENYINRTELAFAYCKSIIVTGTKDEVPNKKDDLRTKLLFVLANELMLQKYTLSTKLLLKIRTYEILDALENLPPLASWREKTGGVKNFMNIPDHYLRTWITENVSDNVVKFIVRDPWYSGIVRSEFFEIDMISESEFMKLPEKIVQKPNPTRTDIQVLGWFFKEYINIQLPDREKIKSNLIMASVIIPKYITWPGLTVNDILKYGLWLINGDYDLKSTWIHGRASRLCRKGILLRLQEYLRGRNFEDELQESKKYVKFWSSLARKIHPGDYTNLFPDAARFFRCIQNRSKLKIFKSWESELQHLYRKGSVSDIVNYIVSTRPEKLGKLVDSLLRKGIREGKEGELIDALIDTNALSGSDICRLMVFYDFREEFLVKRYPKRLKPIGQGTAEAIQDILFRKLLDITKPNTLIQGRRVYLDNILRNKSLPGEGGISWQTLPRTNETYFSENEVIQVFYTTEDPSIEKGDLFYIRLWNTDDIDHPEFEYSTSKGEEITHEDLKGTNIVNFNIAKIRENRGDIKYITISLCYSFSEISLGWRMIKDGFEGKKKLVDTVGDSPTILMIDLENMVMVEFDEKYKLSEMQQPLFLCPYSIETEFLVTARKIRYSMYDFLENYYLKSGALQIVTGKNSPAEVRVENNEDIGDFVLKKIIGGE